MAIIKPTRKFIGSDLNNKAGSKYIKDGVKQVLFNKNNNKDGAHLFFLPPYTTDVAGNGVWYKVFLIRDNFGTSFKEKFAVKQGCPVEYFERQFKLRYPDEAKPVDIVDDTGQKRKQYPNHGRQTKRVIYNVAYATNLDAGNHILDLPVFMGASQITDWLETKDTKGREKPMLNDPSRAIPVFIKLKDGGSGNPWQIQPDQNDPSVLPDELADSDQLYNLDTDVLEYKSNEELIEKLRGFYTPDIFDACMEGFPGFDKVIVQGGVSNAAKSAPAISKIGKTLGQPTADAPVPQEFVDDDVMFDDPVTTPTKDAKAAADFLRSKKRQ